MPKSTGCDLFRTFRILSLLFFLAVHAFAAVPEYFSPIDVTAAPDGKMLYIAGATGKQILYFDSAAEKVIETITVSDKLTGIAVSPDGRSLYAAAGDYDGKVYIVDVNNAKVETTIDVGHSPTAPVISSDGKTLYICQKFKDNVAVIDLATRKVISEISVIRSPFAAAITPDGTKFYVANSYPAGRVDGEFSAAAVSVIDTSTRKVVNHITFPNGSVDLKGIAVSPDGQFVYVTHILARYQLPTTQLERGWINTNAITIIKVGDSKTYTTVLFDDVDLGAANPWGLACTADGKYLCVAHSGTHELSIIDREGLHQKISDNSTVLENIPNTLSFLLGLRRRIQLSGNGPRNLAVVGDTAYIGEYFSDSLGLVDVNVGSARSIRIGPDVKMTTARKGEMLFHDARLCFQMWQSCASCHPIDGRPHPLNWDLLNDGIGNPKNTKSLLLSHNTPPAMITGVRDKAETAVRAGIRYIQFAVRPEEDAEAIDVYLKTLTSDPSPYLVKTKGSVQLQLSKTAEKGKEVFKDAQCSHCHRGPYYTDMKSHNVGTGKGSEKNRAFDTPTLIEVWRTAPYLNDGSAATMMDVLTVFNEDDKHGKTSDLSQEELSQLAEYILSL
jgi:YVTN family beta-propeller protein